MSTIEPRHVDDLLLLSAASANDLVGQASRRRRRHIDINGTRIRLWCSMP